MSPLHPPKEQLIAFGQGRLAPEESVRVEQHLEGCHDCCETLLDLKDDTFVELLKFTKSADVPEQPVVAPRRPARGLSGTGTTPDHPEATSDESAHSATVLVQSGEPVALDELPAELRDHPRYCIVELIGRGGMGNVYRAEHRLMNRPVALKLINSQLIQHPHAVERFRREVQAAAKLSHPNIVAAYDAEKAGNAHFLVMEFVEGTDLASVVKQRGPMSVAEACECIRQAATGLQHAHEKGMVHRDIKPHNLMLATGRQVRILDFGLAGFAEAALESSPVAPRQECRTSDETESRDHPSEDDPAATRDRLSCRGATGLLEATAAHLTTIGSVMGTPDYMAPEQAADAHSADIRADIYSLGCTLHFLLTGKPPFEADNVLMKLKAHAEQLPTVLTTLRNDVPIELANVVARMMAKNPAERLQTPAEVAAALAPFAQPVETPPGKRTLRSVLAAAAAILLAGVIYITTDKGRIEIRNEVDDVDVVVSRGGEEVRTIDLATGSQVTWMPSGDYTISLKQNRNDIHIENSGFKLTRWGKEIVRVKRVTASETTDRIVVAVKRGGHYFVDGREANGAFDLLNRLKFILEQEPDREVVIESEKDHGMTVLKPLVELVREAGVKRLRLPDWVPPAEQAKLNLSGAVATAGSDPAATSKSASNSTSLTALRDLATVTAYLNDPRNNRGGSVPVALLGNNGRVAFRFGTWLVVFEGIVCDPKATILGFSNFNVPQPGSSGEGTVDFGTGDKLPGVLIKFKFASEQNEISINNHRFKLRDQATKLEFDDKAYDATNSLQTILVARDGSTKLESLKKADDKPDATQGISRNLLTDPSFENTPLTQLPNGWRAWLNDGQEFRCEVVAGGRTGQRCLRISGKGTRGVVFANDIKVDRTKRYTLKGWAKFEGDKDARAIIKFNYFRGSEFLGVHDLVGATADQPDWQLFEKTDALDVYPTADHFYAMCNVEGSGTGWFDDLELVAYDRDKLSKDFDARHGRHNRLHGPNSLHRWVGTWETEYVFREFDNSPAETRLAMTTVNERTLGNYFLISHAKALPVTRKDRKPTPADPPANAAALGGEERLMLLTFDQNLGAFRQWLFSSNGKAFEWRGPWNNELQTLQLRMLPDASNLHSSERFVDDDHIEARLMFQYVMGQRDAGCWTATRKAFDGKVDVPIAKAHVAQPAELSQLNKFAGEWTIRAAYKPSVWNPEPREETARESSVWILGGRFLMTRAFNEKDELTSIWIATWEPREKSNRFWFFNADGSSGEWRLTWDEASSGFHFRAVDLPTGWSGTGFNRWVNEDAFDNQGLIKDENGRVMLDSTQERRRKKSD